MNVNELIGYFDSIVRRCLHAEYSNINRRFTMVLDTISDSPSSAAILILTRNRRPFSIALYSRHVLGRKYISQELSNDHIYCCTCDCNLSLLYIFQPYGYVTL